MVKDCAVVEAPLDVEADRGRREMLYNFKDAGKHTGCRPILSMTPGYRSILDGV